jgi:hypothetical protein
MAAMAQSAPRQESSCYATAKRLYRDDLHPNPVTLLTNIPLLNVATAQQGYADWRLRGRIKHGYRFDQEQGLDVEDVRVRTLERMRRIFALVLAAAQFVFFIARHWPEEAVLWLRKLGGKLGLKSDRDGPDILLRGLSAVLQSVATLSWLAIQPFPHHLFGRYLRCGQSPVFTASPPIAV